LRLGGVPKDRILHKHRRQMVARPSRKRRAHAPRCPVPLPGSVARFRCQPRMHRPVGAVQ
jgi:hypothetical protein